jgi:hypothetical protein
LGQGPRNYSDQTLKKLFALAGNECSFPSCNQQMVNRQNAKNSNICHIEAANPGGERYNANMSDQKRADYENLILLCIQHHDETDDVETYSVDILKQMKTDHEDSQGNRQISRQPSMLSKAINAIADLDIESVEKSLEDNKVYDIKRKITHNALRSNAHLIHTYKIYHRRINAIYDELEQAGSIKKIRLLNNINSLYLTISGKYILDSPDHLDIIRANSDIIFNDVYDELCNLAEKSTHWKEDIVFSVRLIMVDAFMRCKILEKPESVEIA